MAYKVLGFTVWKLVKLVVRYRVATTRPSTQVGAAVVVTVLIGAGAVALARREAGQGD